MAQTPLFGICTRLKDPNDHFVLSKTPFLTIRHVEELRPPYRTRCLVLTHKLTVVDEDSVEATVYLLSDQSDGTFGQGTTVALKYMQRVPRDEMPGQSIVVVKEVDVQPSTPASDSGSGLLETELDVEASDIVDKINGIDQRRQEIERQMDRAEKLIAAITPESVGNAINECRSIAEASRPREGDK